MSDLPFDYALSLGGWCGVAHNLRRRFRTNAAYPFDWWEFDHAGLLRLLDEDFAALFTLENLFIDETTGHVGCRHYQVMHRHDFATGPDGRALPHFAPQLPHLKEKFAALIARMDRNATPGKRLLAVREELFPTGQDVPPEEAGRRATALYERLRARWPEAEVTLLVVNPTLLPVAGLKPPGPGIRFDWLTRRPEADQWQAEAWDEVFTRQGLTLRRAAMVLDD
jgi:hypothetical protein